LGKIYRIDDYRPTRCYCDAAKARKNFFAAELAVLARGASPVLHLDDEGWRSIASKVGQWSVIYSSDLLSGLRLKSAQQFVKKAASALSPGGCLILANVALHDNVSACRSCAIPAKIYRTEGQMAELATGVPDEVIAGQSVFRDNSGLNVYLELHKSPTATTRTGNVASKRVLGSTVEQHRGNDRHTR
jgi:hypothetical protein